MRLTILDRGQRLRARVFIRAVKAIAGGEPDDVAKTSMYRPDFFGRAWLAYAREVLRGPSEWTAGEREIMAAFVSRLNACVYCIDMHTGTATIARGSPITVDMLDDYRAGWFDQRLTATLAFLERHQRDPNGLSAADVDVARMAGVSDAAIEDALYVAFLFNLINRAADAFGYSFGDEDGRLAQARALHRIGYRLPGFLLA